MLLHYENEKAEAITPPRRQILQALKPSRCNALEGDPAGSIPEPTLAMAPSKAIPIGQ